MNTYKRSTINKKPVYKFTVENGRSTRDLKVTFSHNTTNPVLLVDDLGEPQLGWRVDLQGRGHYDFDSLPMTLQPLVRDAVGAILDSELELVGQKIHAHNTISVEKYQTICNVVPGVYEVEEAFTILGRSHALGFTKPLSDEALQVSHESLQNFVDIERLDEAVADTKEAQATVDDLKESISVLGKMWKENMIPSQELAEGIGNLIRDLEAGWISYDPGETLKDKVLDRLNEIDDLVPEVSDYVPEEFD